MTYQVNEIFTSIQGEGVHAGVPATFIRLQGCTVGCPWCDTKYTWAKGGQRMETIDIVRKVQARHVVITGGEPTMYDLDELLNMLHYHELFTQVETSGQQWFKGKRLPAWITWSPKPNLNWCAPKDFYRKADEVKFVVDNNLDYETVVRVATRVFDERENFKCAMVLMPEGCPPTNEQAALAMDFATRLAVMYYNTRYGDRLQYRIGVK